MVVAASWAVTWMVGCTSETPDLEPPGLAIQHRADADRADAGAAWLWGETTPAFGFPLIGFQSLALLQGAPPWSTDQLFGALRDDYGFIEDPDDPLGPPVGVQIKGDMLQFTCLSCHADRVAGELIVGGSNGTVEWEALAGDLTILAGLAGFAAPLSLEGFSAAPGTHDAWGLGFELAAQEDPAADLNDDMGFQQSPAWWSRRYKQALYLDGSGSATGRNTMAAMYLGYGATLPQIQAMGPDLDDAWATMVTLPVPAWRLTEIDADRADRGEGVFDEHCAECHGHYTGDHDRTFPDRVEDVGTDPVRHENMRAVEADFLNASWFGEGGEFRDTDGYLAPVLHGVWATPPYFHNGAVPTLWDVLDSTGRPTVWRRSGNGRADYDEAKVGLRVEVVEPGAAGAYDTRQRGLDNGGHPFGDGLSDDDRWAVIEFLKGL